MRLSVTTTRCAFRRGADDTAQLECAGQGASVNILIAEDDNVSRRILEAMLRKWGYELVVTCDGNQAWEALQRPGAPQLVILDWNMPGIDGIEICRRIRAQSDGALVYIILLTARSNKEETVVGLDAGANDYITKPFDRDELKARVRVGERVVELQHALSQRVEELQAASEHIETLQGILPVCANCHRIRTDEDSWQKIEAYLEQHANIQVSHGVCPECMEKLYPEFMRDEKKG